MLDDLTLNGCRQWLDQLAEAQFAQFESGADIADLVGGRALAIDQLLVALWQRDCSDLGEYCLVAVGGYGRGELHPFSDIDLMVLVDTEPGDAEKQRIGDFFTLLWDLKLDVGHSVRSITDSVRESKADVTVLTTLMETRCVVGPSALYQQMVVALGPDRLWDGKSYFKAKFAEQQHRHSRYRDLSYSLEPNLKGGPGGLRDAQMIDWVAKRHYNAHRLSELVAVGFLEPAEYDALKQGIHFLWAVRFALHQLAGRREDRLLFDHQRELARWFGYVDVDNPNNAVEQFMQRYYRTIQRLQQLNEVMLQTMQEDILGLRGGRAVMISDELLTQGDFLGITDEEVFVRRPVLLLEIFRELQKRSFIKGLRASAIRAISRAIPLIDDDFRASRDAKRIFMNLLSDGNRLPQLLIWMHRFEVLDRYLPVFARVVGRMQFDLFHVYTVDYHTLFVVREAHGLLQDDVDDKRFPLVRTVAQRLYKRELLLIACFFHDIAKGRGGDHSELGERDAEEFCQSHGLAVVDTELVKWLVRHHLVMSVTAQKKDIADPEVVNAFAAEVGNNRYLNYLYLLTVADICGTNPKLWNRWKANLLADLYRLTRAALRRGLDNPVRRSRLAADTRDEALRMLAHQALTAQKYRTIWKVLPEDYFVRHSADQICWQTISMVGQPRPMVGVRYNTNRHVTEVFVHADNVDGTFATIVAALDRRGLSIVDAKIFSVLNETVLDTFDVLPRDEKRALDAAELTASLRQQLSERPLQPELRAQPMSRRLRQFQKPPRLMFSAVRGGEQTLLELICIDQPGLLANIALILLEQGVRIHGARIATFGERAEDYFWLSDQHNRPLTAAAEQALRQAMAAELDHSDQPD